MVSDVIVDMRNKFAGADEKICLWGAGAYGRKIYCLLKICGMQPDFFGDNKLELLGTEIMDGRFCHNAESLPQESAKTLIIIAVKGDAAKEIERDLAERGFGHIIFMADIEDELKRGASDFINGFGADIVSYMASSGEGSEKCLERGCLPVPVHFYQPIPNIADLERRDVWSKVSELAGIKWETEKFLDNFKDISRYAPKPDWARRADGDTSEFSLDNSCFSYMCASVLYGMITKRKPRRIIEIGSGNSSKVIRRALRDGKIEAKYTIIDPYCALTYDDVAAEIIKKPVEETDLALFERLEENDILFIDSSHTVRIGGDVNFEILEVLPRLAPGVVVHFHDIGMPYEYPKISVNPKLRVFWTESYLLQAFLAHNNEWEILLPVAWLCHDHLDMARELYPNMEEAFDWSSGSFWLRRITR